MASSARVISTPSIRALRCVDEALCVIDGLHRLATPPHMPLQTSVPVRTVPAVLEKWALPLPHLHLPVPFPHPASFRLSCETALACHAPRKPALAFSSILAHT